MNDVAFYSFFTVVVILYFLSNTTTGHQLVDSWTGKPRACVQAVALPQAGK